MMRLLLLLFPALLSASEVDLASRLDPHSNANVDAVVVEHLALDLSVDFAKRRLSGSATLDLKWKNARARQLVLDTRDLAVERVQAATGKGAFKTVRYKLGAADPILGSALIIELPKGRDRVRISYHTTPEAAGLQWLSARQTKGKKQPFLFTQSQAIQARSWIPLQDTPAVRFTYEARIRAPKALRAVMSADNDPAAARDGDYSFSMPQPIPSYLMALAVGELAFKAISPRVGVYAEPALLEAAWNEFAETEQMMVKAEALFGAYRWGRYDLLILPPSFPFGGMENPRLSFITPTVIAGDRSLVGLIAHELAHSWSGNLVTNATWRDLWLNEGFTVFLEGRIMEEVYGVERAQMEAALSVDELKREMVDLPLPDQRLAPDFRGRDPDDVFSGVPYTKGQWFLLFLERRFGRPTFDAFLRGYFDHFAFKSVTTAQFLEYLNAELLAKHPNKVSMAEVEEWINQPGIPKNAPEQVSDRFAAVGRTRDAFLGGAAASTLKTKNWSAHEWLHFLNSMPAQMSSAQLAQLDAAFKFTQSQNSEIAHAWFLIGIRSDYREIDGALDAYLQTIGRRKLVVPLYEALLKRADRREFALDAFERAKPGYHPLTVGTVDALIQSTATAP